MELKEKLKVKNNISNAEIPQTKNNVYNNITLINVFLCFCVVMIHLTASPVTELRKDSIWYALIFAVNKLLQFSVPAFIFLSGFKLYNAYGDKKIDLKKFFSGRLKKIIVPYIISVMIYFVYYYAKKWVSIRDLPQYILLGTLVAHFYYIIIAVQFYVLFPILKSLFNKSAMAVTLLSLLCTFYFNEIFYFTYSDRIAGTYIFYFVLGMLFAKHKYCFKNNRLCLMCIAGYVITAVVHVRLSYMASLGKLIYSYAASMNIAYVAFAASAIYCIFSRFSDRYQALDGFAQTMGKVSYNVYLYHILVMLILQHNIFPHFYLTIKYRFAISFIIVYSLILAYGYLNKKLKSTL